MRYGYIISLEYNVIIFLVETNDTCIMFMAKFLSHYILIIVKSHVNSILGIFMARTKSSKSRGGRLLDKLPHEKRG